MRSRLQPTTVLAACILVFTGALSAGEIKVMTSGAFTAAYLDLKPAFEHSSKHQVVTLATTMGVGAESIPSRLRGGETVDVVIVDDDSLKQLIAEGLVAAGSRVPLARSAIGMAVKAGSRKPDISSVPALRRALLEANSIAYSASISGTYLSTEVFRRLGIADQIAGKSHRIERERVGAVVARGDAELGFQQISELLPVHGIEIVGPLPDAVQKISVFSAGVAAHSANPDAARELIRFLASPESARAVSRSGLEPIAAHRATERRFRALSRPKMTLAVRIDLLLAPAKLCRSAACSHESGTTN